MDYICIILYYNICIIVYIYRFVYIVVAKLEWIDFKYVFDICTMYLLWLKMWLNKFSLCFRAIRLEELQWSEQDDQRWNEMIVELAKLVDSFVIEMVDWAAYIYIYICMYMYIYSHIHINVYLYIHIIIYKLHVIPLKALVLVLCLQGSVGLGHI